jgi:putative ABC transport system permease protein
VLAALGMGVMLILAVFLMQQGIIREMHADAAPTTPNVFFIDISAQELPGVLSLLMKQPGVRGTPETLPVVSGRIESIDGVATDKLRLQNYPKRMLQSVPLTWADGMPAGMKLTSGKWWQAGDSTSVAVSARVADRLHLHLGSAILFDSGDRSIPSKVAAIYKSDGQHVYARSEFILASGELQGLPTVWYADLHVDPPLVGAMQRALFANYPTITVINIADIIETIQGVVNQITMVVRFLAGFSMLSGAVILASSVASTRFRRIREVVVLKTLGATRNHIAQVFSVEFIVLGLLAGFVGVVFANLLVRVLLHRLEIASRINWDAAVAAILATALLATITGWVASFRILSQKPLEVLREE